MSDLPAPRRRRKRRIIIWSSVLVVLLAVVAFLLPYMLKRYIETHSEEWIGRKVTIGSIVLNPFTFKYGVYGVTCFEPKSEAVFVSWKEISLRADLWDGFQRNNWRFTKLRITDPYFHIVQQGDRFNFSDLMELGGTDTTTATDTSTTRFSMMDIELDGGRIDYASDLLHDPVQVIGLKAVCTEISSERTRMDFGLGFGLKSGGRMDGGFMIDTESSAYGINAHLKAFDVAQLLPYLQDFFACRALTGAVDLDLNVLDNYADTTSLALSAAVEIGALRLVDPNGEELFALKKAGARLDTLVAREQRLEMGNVLIDGAGLRFVMLADGTDNWTRLLKLDTLTTAGDTIAQLQTSESNVFVMLADYVSYLGEQVIASEYTADSLALTHGTVRFEDHTPAQPLRYTISTIQVASQRVTTDQAKGRITASATLQETGSLTADASFDPNDLRNVTVGMHVDGLALNHLDPYGRWYAAHPLEDGVLSYETTTSVQAGRIDSKNTIRVDQLRVGKKVDDHDPEIYVLPMRLAAGLLKDVHGVVTLEVPVQGDLNDPEFRVWPIVWQVLKNLVVKAAAAPAKLLVRAVDGADEADLERVRFAYLQYAPDKTQRKTLAQLVSALKSKPELSVDLVPLVDRQAEVQEAAVFQVKRAYLFDTKATLEADDSTRLAALSSRDSAFTAYVEQRTPALAGRSMHERCLSIAGAEACTNQANDLEYARRENIMQFLLAEGLPAERVRFREGTAAELAGQRGVPGYRFVYDVGEEQ